MDFRKLHECSSARDLMNLRLLLDSEGIRYTVQGENISNIAFFQISSYSAPVILVWEEDYEKATEVLNRWLAHEGRHARPSRLGLLDKLTIIFEYIIAGIFFPGSLKQAIARRKKAREMAKAQSAGQDQQSNGSTR